MFPANEQLRFEQQFGVKIAHWYGHSEYATLAYCCRRCRGFHFYPTYGGVELLPSEAEGCRRVVASSFNRIGTQFVRYETGDLAVDPVDACTADNFPRASAIVGRSQETFVDSSGRRRSLYGYAFGDLDHDAFYDQIRDIQFVQDKAGFLRVRIVTNPGAEREQIQRVFQRHIPVARLEFEYVSAIERSPSGKRRYFVDAAHSDATGSQ
jgi:phenylacetate-coenzyme A ligase PaaK-like adenylate-forming protein